MIDTAYSDVPSSPKISGKDEDLIDEIRQRYREWDSEWQDARRERNIDIRYISGDPWDPEDRKAREDAGRPCINHDELNQYVNQLVNGVRQNKRGIKVDPKGDGSNDQSAEMRQDLIRTIESDSDAPSIYAKAFQDMVEGSYAFFRLSRRYVSNNAASDSASLFDQEIILKPIQNPNSVLYDPRCKEPDWSDARGCFVIERVPKKEFKRRWPKAQVTDFSWEHMQVASDWILTDDVIVAEYWRIETDEVTKYLLESGEVVDNPRGRPVEKKRVVEERIVRQYMTNGVEILGRRQDPEPGNLLPIVPMIGLERYVDDGGFSRRVLFSLARLARDPQMSLAYLNSQQMEEAGMTPKSPYLGYKGQFDSSRKMWETVTKQPWAFLEADIPDNWPAGQVPPLPQRVPFTPNFQSYEIAKDSARRAIQAAMGITPLPTAMQRNNEKSGIALQRIEDLEALGSYHFIAGFDRALRLAGRVIDQWIPSVYSRERTLHVRRPDDTYQKRQLNTDAPYVDEKTGLQVHYPVEEADHTVSISTGPSYQSQRQAVDDFLEQLIGQLPKLPISPPQAAKLLSMAIQMKNLGPKGDEMAELISPSQPGGPQAGMAQLQQAQAQLQQQGILIQQLQAELQKLTMERQSKVVEGEYKLRLEKMRNDSDLLIERLKVDAQIASAEVQTKSQIVSERISALEELFTQAHQQMHEIHTQAADQAHEMNMSQQEHQQAMAQQEQAGQQQQDLAAQQAQQQQPEEPAAQEGQQ